METRHTFWTPGWLLGAPLCALAAWLLGFCAPPAAMVRAEVRETTSREHFQAGDERNAAVLAEMAATLNRIDGRLARLEALAVTRQPASPDTTPAPRPRRARPGATP